MLKREGQHNDTDPEQNDYPVRVVLTGYRATGKSVVGKLLASQLGYRFIDTDEELAATLQCSVAEYVRERGWPAFRNKEKEVLERLSWMNQVVIATGGGAVLHREEWRNLRKNSLVVWLQADAKTISQRLQVDPASDRQRPSLTGSGALEEVGFVLAEREEYYQEGSDMAIDTTVQTPEEIAAQIEQHITNIENG